MTNEAYNAKNKTYALILEGLVPPAPPTTEMLFILTSDVNLLSRRTRKM